MSISTQRRLLISRKTSYERLLAQVDERSGGPGMIVGTGARARKRLDRLHRERPNVVDRPWTLDGREHIAFFRDDSATVIAFGHDEPGRPPVVEVEGPDGVVR